MNPLDITNKEYEELIGKIQKLMAMEGSTNANEAAVASAKVSELLMRYNLTMDQVEQALPADKHQGVEEQAFFIDPDKEHNISSRHEWEINLVSTLANNNMCRALFTKSKFYLIGKPHNIEVVKFLYT